MFICQFLFFLNQPFESATYDSYEYTTPLVCYIQLMVKLRVKQPTNLVFHGYTWL